MLNTVIRFSEGAVVEEHPGVPAWVFGLTGFAVLCLLLLVVTRFNPNR